MTNYRTVVALTNGLHKIVRLDKGQIAHVVSEFRKFQRRIFDDVVELNLNGSKLCLNEIVSFKFINEWTGEELLSIN
jgi:hypothetical protein